MKKLLKCINHGYYKVVNDKKLFGMHLVISSPVPVYEEIYPNYGNSKEHLSFQHIFRNRRLGELALQVSRMKTFCKIWT